jgi:hypothetical protein
VTVGCWTTCPVGSRCRTVVWSHGVRSWSVEQVTVVYILLILTYTQYAVECAIFPHWVVDISQVDVKDLMVLTVGQTEFVSHLVCDITCHDAGFSKTHCVSRDDYRHQDC